MTSDLPAPADYGLTWGEVALLTAGLGFNTGVQELMRHTYAEEHVAEAWLKEVRYGRWKGQL